MFASSHRYRQQASSNCQRREIPAQNGWGRVRAWAGAPAAEKVGTASGCSIRQDREGAVSGLNLGPPSAAGSRTVQPDVATSREGCVEIRLVEQVIAERFQYALRDFLERAPESQDAGLAILFSQGPVQAVMVQQLHEQMADLQQVIIGLGVVPVLAEDVLQVQAAVFLNVEAFVFDFGA